MIGARARQRFGLRFSHPAVLIGTWFGSGLLPAGPGTWGSVAALPFAWIILRFGGLSALFAAAALVFAAGWWSADALARASGIKDAGSIVVDEVVGQWLTLGIAASAIAPLGFRSYVIGFLLFRFFDIVKPWPVSWADRRVSGGLGVMLDDVLAAVYAGVLLAFGRYLLER
jgi:phosphatidylglycerophosphatase A